jgi:hypothetical protein
VTALLRSMIAAMEHQDAFEIIMSGLRVNQAPQFESYRKL